MSQLYNEFPQLTERYQVVGVDSWCYLVFDCAHRCPESPCTVLLKYIIKSFLYLLTSEQRVHATIQLISLVVLLIVNKMAVGYKEFINSDKGVVIFRRYITIRELIIIIFAVLFVAAAAACSVTLIIQHTRTTVKEVDVQSVCTSYSCLYSSSKLAALRDNTVSPCDDFYNYACGKFMYTEHIIIIKSA